MRHNTHQGATFRPRITAFSIAILLTACGPGLGATEMVDLSHLKAAYPVVAHDLRLLFDVAKHDLRRCAEPFRSRGHAVAEIALVVGGKPGHKLKVHRVSVDSPFGPPYNLCVVSALREARVIASSYYDAATVLQLRIDQLGVHGTVR